MRRGARISVDVGTVRIGVAGSDPDGLLATPVETVPRGPGDLDRLAAIAADREAIEIVVGLPRSLSGAEGPAAEQVRSFAVGMAERVAPRPVRLVDERFSTVVATRGMRASGVSARKGRASVDQAAAVVILQAALDSERVGGQPPGEVLLVQR